jgi:hypothetical protein
MALLTLHATHAVIFRVISGGLWSPNCSRNADTGTEEDPFMVLERQVYIFLNHCHSQ